MCLERVIDHYNNLSSPYWLCRTAQRSTLCEAVDEITALVTCKNALRCSEANKASPELYTDDTTHYFSFWDADCVLKSYCNTSSFLSRVTHRALWKQAQTKRLTFLCLTKIIIINEWKKERIKMKVKHLHIMNHFPLPVLSQCWDVEPDLHDVHHHTYRITFPFIFPPYFLYHVGRVPLMNLSHWSSSCPPVWMMGTDRGLSWDEHMQ